MLSREEVGAMIAAMPDGPEKDQAAEYALACYGEPPQTARFAPYRFDPKGYLETFLGVTPWAGLDDNHPGQLQILEAMVLAVRQQLERRDFQHGRINQQELQFWSPDNTDPRHIIRNWIRVESGNGIGKTGCLGFTANWFFDCFNSIIYTFHTSAKQDKLTTWKEIRTRRLGRGLPGRILDTRLDLGVDQPDRFAESRSTSDSHGKGEEKIKGQHNEFLLFMVDEADGVADFVFDAIETMESGGISIVLMTANPRSRSSRFHRLKKKSYAKTLRISSLYHPNVVHNKEVIPGAVMRAFIAKKMEKGVDVVETLDEEKFDFTLPYDIVVGDKLYKTGTIFRPKDDFMVTVLGIAPPTSLEKTIISVGVYEASKARLPEGGDSHIARVGVDCARFGDDNGTVYIRWQDAVWRACELVKQDANVYIDVIRKECLKLKEKGVTSLHIRVDAGYGSAVIDALSIDQELIDAFQDFQVFEVQFNGRPYNQKDYANLVTEMYYEAAESLRGLCVIDPPEQLEIDLCEREYKYSNQAGKTKKILEPKEDFKKRNGRSPDDGDGLVLAVAPDYCFEKVTITVVQPATEMAKPKSQADQLAAILGLGKVTPKPTGERVLIIGWPKAGKTTLAESMGGGRSTDEVMHHGWSEASQIVSAWFDAPGPWVIEGVAVPRALRKWRDANPGKQPPVDRIIRLMTPRIELDVAQAAMGKGMDTVFAELLPWLESVKIEERS